MGYDYHARLFGGGGGPPTQEELDRAVTYRYTHNSRVPGSGTRYLRTGQGFVCSQGGDRLMVASTLTAISVEVELADVTNDYDVEVISSPSGVAVVLGTLALPSTSKGASTRALSVAVPINTEVGVRMVRTAGAGQSDFRRINVTVEYTTPEP